MTVMILKKKCLQPIPEVGKKYHCFDDGKITFSRHYIIKVDEVLGYMAFRKKYPNFFSEYIKAVKQCSWLFSKHTDKFIITYKGECDKFGVFIRTKEGGWFGICDWWNSGELDVTGELWNRLIKNIDLFDYSDEEKEQLIKEGTIDETGR